MAAILRNPQWLLILASWTLYSVAFECKATIPLYPSRAYFTQLPPTVGKDVSETYHALVPSGDFNDLSGSDAFNLAWIFRKWLWMANAALWLATVMILWRMWSCATLFAMAGFGFTVAHAFQVVANVAPDVTLGLGYWLWMSSLGLMFTGSLVGWRWLVPRDRQRWPAQVFRGWRGLALGSWLAVGFGVLVAWWCKQDLHPSSLWRDLVIGSWLMMGLMALVVEWFWNDPAPPGVWRGVAFGQWFVFGVVALAVWCFWPDIYPPKPPR